MKEHREKIKKFSKTIYVMLQIVFVALIVTGAIEFFAWLVQIGQIPLLFKFGDVTVVMPFFITEGITINGSTFTFGIIEVVRTIITVIIVGMAKYLFKKLRVDGSPFLADIVKGLKTLSITLLFAGVFTGLNSFLSAGIVWLLCIVFEYGCVLQNESDTTL